LPEELFLVEGIEVHFFAHRQGKKIPFYIFTCLLLVLTITRCVSRQDFYNVIEEESVPDVNLKTQDSIDLESGTGTIDLGTVQVD
jgi:hypothetical protein